MDQDGWMTALIAGVSAIVAAGLGVLGTWLANRLAGNALVQRAMNEQFAGIMKEKDQQLAELRVELKTLRGGINQILQSNESLKELLRRQGVEIPRTPHFDPLGSIIELPATDITATP